MTKFFFLGFKAGLHDFGLAVNTVVTAILLTIIYVLGVGITALLLRARGVYLLPFTYKKETVDSYWTDLRVSKKANQYYRQY